ncbi:DNA-directed RNA polymerase specialized sigma subunit [Paenibacillus polymyxa]|nr:DNA-directed RNA polymerase specialized sigma subunit [Paenibacillus polymyxa]
MCLRLVFIKLFWMSTRSALLKLINNEYLEDLISFGTIGLMKAIESFQTGKGTKLATFAARCIENEILMHLRSPKNTQRRITLTERRRRGESKFSYDDSTRKFVYTLTT